MTIDIGILSTGMSEAASCAGFEKADWHEGKAIGGPENGGRAFPQGHCDFSSSKRLLLGTYLGSWSA